MILASADYAEAQTIPFGNTLDAARQQQLFQALREKLLDPASAVLIGVKTGQDGVICGLISAKRADGEPTGYKQFAFDPEKQLLALPPEAQHDLDLRDLNLMEKLHKLMEIARWGAAACPAAQPK
jgi:hypothetical protein